MPLYYLWTTINDEYAIVDFKDSQHRLANFFIGNQGDGKFLTYTTPAGIAQEGDTRENIGHTDYIASSISIPIFSPTFVDKLGQQLQEELSFHPCIVWCEGEAFPFFLEKPRSTWIWLTEQKLSIEA
jgi:hypothetical protein